MVHPWPKAPVKVGEQPAPETVDVLQGTAPAELQRIVGANWHTSGIKPVSYTHLTLPTSDLV